MRSRKIATTVWMFFLVIVGRVYGKTPLPEFPYQDGWLGADVAFSVPFADGRTLWLFGDTFVGAPGEQTRNEKTPMPRNSIGISRCSDSHCAIQYFWSTKGSRPRAFFDLAGDHWFWPLDGFVSKGVLYVVLEEMHAEGTGALGFDYSGVTLATVRNFKETPERWRITYQKVVSGNRAIPGVSVVAGRPDFNPYPKEPDGAAWIYFFTLRKDAEGKAGVALTRLPIAQLGQARQAAGHWQYLSAAGDWVGWTQPGSLPEDAKTLFHHGYSEFTVRFHSDRGQWVAVAPAAAMVESRAVYSVAPGIDGPWSAPQTLLDYPEMKKTSADFTPKVFCYAAKEQPAFEAAGKMVFTYACNSMEEPEIFRNMRLYHPVVVVNDAPAGLAGKP